MNGIHDMGGMTCFGPIVREEKEPVFHAPWEKRMLALLLAGELGVTGDEARHAKERLNPVTYLTASYYEGWLIALENLALEKGILTQEELATGIAQATGSGRTPLSPNEVVTLVHQGTPFRRDSGRLSPQFQLGDTVRARNIHALGHTRLPRYVRGKQGVIDRVHGTFVYPDTNAHGLGEQPQPLYSVRFEARELWGPEASARDCLYIDLWEDYLDPVERGSV